VGPTEPVAARLLVDEGGLLDHLELALDL